LATNLAIWFLPLIAFFIITGLTFVVPVLKGFNFGGGIKIGAPLIAMWLALSVYTGAFIAENVRAGIQAVSKGQTEAAGALGIRPGRIMSLIILPQALRVIIPPMISNFLNITKNSSLAILVGYADVTATLGGITLNQTGRAIECVVLLMLFYLIISLTISGVANVYNNSTKLKER
jgi:general L-amino acid transport system permease protein